MVFLREFRKGETMNGTLINTRPLQLYDSALAAVVDFCRETKGGYEYYPELGIISFSVRHSMLQPDCVFDIGWSPQDKKLYLRVFLEGVTYIPQKNIGQIISWANALYSRRLALPRDVEDMSFYLPEDGGIGYYCEMTAGAGFTGEECKDIVSNMIERYARLVVFLYGLAQKQKSLSQQTLESELLPPLRLQ